MTRSLALAVGLVLGIVAIAVAQDGSMPGPAWPATDRVAPSPLPATGTGPAEYGPVSPASPQFPPAAQYPSTAVNPPLDAPSVPSPAAGNPLVSPPAPSTTPSGPVRPTAPPPTDDSAKSEPAKIWEGSFEIGVNGTDGNSETFNLRTGAKLKRKTSDNVWTTDLDYRKDNNGSKETANQAILDSRDEVLFKDTPWNWFTHGNLDYDEFKPYDLLLALDTGVGYRFLKNDAITLTGRIGGGTSHEFNGPKDYWAPEAVFGGEFEYRVAKRHKFSLSCEYTPDVTNFDNYRMRSKAAWEILLDEATHLSLKFNVIDRYKNQPEGARPNDLDYSVVLLWSF